MENHLKVNFQSTKRNKHKRPKIEITFAEKELPNEKELYILGWLTLLSGQENLKEESKNNNNIT